MKRIPMLLHRDSFHNPGLLQESKGRKENSPVDCFQAARDSHAAESGIIVIIKANRIFVWFVFWTPSFTMKKTSCFCASVKKKQTLKTP